MCSSVAHDKKQPAYVYEKSSLYFWLITKYTTTEALEALGVTLNFIYIWLKLFEDKYERRSGIYNKAMAEMFKQIPITVIKSLSSKQKVQTLITQIGGIWYMEKVLRDYHH